MLVETKELRAGKGKRETMDLPTILDVLRLNPEKLPQWLATDGPVRFERQTFFASRTVFYPGSVDDGQPIKLCAQSRAVHSFVYVDQDAILERLHDAELGCRGYLLPHRRLVSPSHLADADLLEGPARAACRAAPPAASGSLERGTRHAGLANDRQ